MALSDYLAGVLGKISDPEKRAQAEAALNDASAAEALAELDRGFLRQSDYSRKQDELRAAQAAAEEARLRGETLYTSNLDWFEANKAKLAGQPASPTIQPVAPVPASLTREQVDALVASKLDAFGNDALGVMASTNTLTARHMAEFGEVLDIRGVMAEAMKGKRTLEDQYALQFKDRLDQKATERATAATAKQHAEWEADFRAKHPNMPYLVRPPSQVETLDGLNKPTTNPTDYSAQSAADEYTRLVAAKG